jgi:CDGSH-type Zn-finger protein
MEEAPSITNRRGDKMSNKHPIMLDLEPGTYYWCSCGKTNNQPFCDGSHEGTSFLPVEFTITEKKQFALCNCQRTRDAPYCDGSHKNI